MYGAGTEFRIEHLGPDSFEIVDGERPEMQHVVPGDVVPHLQHRHAGP